MKTYKYRKFEIINDGRWWYSFSLYTDFTDLANTIQDAKNAIDDFYNGFHPDFKRIEE